MNVTSAELVAQVGELAIENRQLRRQLAESQAKLAACQNQLKLTTAALAAKDQADAGPDAPESRP